MDAEQKELREWQNQQESALFRRGANLSTSERFRDVIETLIGVVEKSKKLDVLVVGVAMGEEPLSVLSVVYSLAEAYGGKMEDMVDLYMVDRKDPLKNDQIVSKVYKQYIDSELPGNRMVLNAIETDDDPRQYRIKRSIVGFLETKLADKTHTHWNTSVQKYLNRDKREYNLIMYNNVDGHVWVDKDRAEIVRGLVGSLKVGGILVTDNGYGGSKRLRELPDFTQIELNLGLKEIRPGIFKRTK